MTKEEYRKYEESVANFMQREHLDYLSTSSSEDPYFSWRPCECCGSTLGGDRYSAAGVNLSDNIIEQFEICVDCTYYAEYGQLDDLTMLLMEEAS